MLKQLYITELYGERTINISFNNDITLLVGRNGSGKTTILNIISIIASGKIEQLIKIEFHEIRLTYLFESKLRAIDIIRKDNESIKLIWKEHTIQLFASSQKNIDFNSENTKEINKSILKNISEEINLLYIPVSRDIKYLEKEEDSYINRFDNFDIDISTSTSYWIDKKNRNKKIVDDSLEYVEKLVKENHRQTFLNFEELNRNMAKNMFQSSFEYQMENGGTREKFDKLIESEGAIKELKLAFKELGYLTDDFEDGIDSFLSKLKKGFRTYTKWTKDPQEYSSEVRDFISNVSHIDRIMRWQKIVQETSQQKYDLQKLMNRFFDIINSFFEESNKELIFDNVKGKLFFVTRSEKKITIDKMSSGEKQIVIFFAFLILESRNKSNGIFIIDEPEISLHVSWQRKFATSIISAAPDIQFIFATHSPEIIAPYRNSRCVVLGSDF